VMGAVHLFRHFERSRGILCTTFKATATGFLDLRSG
jgi:hypothetical protein